MTRPRFEVIVTSKICILTQSRIQNVLLHATPFTEFKRQFPERKEDVLTDQINRNKRLRWQAGNAGSMAHSTSTLDTYRHVHRVTIQDAPLYFQSTFSGCFPFI